MVADRIRMATVQPTLSRHLTQLNAGPRSDWHACLYSAMLYIELAIIIVLILINGLLALAELAIVSSRRARLQALVDRDVIGSRRALALASDPGRFCRPSRLVLLWSASCLARFPEPRSGCVLRKGLPSWACPPVLPRLSALAWWSPLLLTFPW